MEEECQNVERHNHNCQSPSHFCYAMRREDNAPKLQNWHCSFQVTSSLLFEFTHNHTILIIKAGRS